jgi:pimeloyl-ACP methyl ester carboxylesterase
VRIELDGFEAYVEQRGDGRPLILVHGLGGGTSIWQKVAGTLAERFRVIAYDLRGLGQSGTPSPPYTLDQLVGDLHGLVTELALGRVALLGHSLGGAVVLAYAAEHPERVNAVVGVAAPSFTPEAQREHLAERAAAARRDGMGPIAELHIARGLPEAFTQAHPDDVATYRGVIAGSDPVGYAAQCGVIADLDLTGGLRRIDAPALLVQGELDTVVPAADARATAAAIPHCSYVELPGCGHVLPFERPGELVEQVLAFLGASGVR